MYLWCSSTRHFVCSICSDPQDFEMYLREQIFMHSLRVCLF